MREAYLFVVLLIRISIGISNELDSTTGRPCSGSGPSATGIPPCDEDKLIAFLAEIQVINPESIVEWAVDNLEPLCRTICMNLKRIDTYLATCTAPQKEDLYMSLIAGVTKLREKLCTQSEFIKQYTIYYPCLHELRNDFEACNGPADWNENTDKDEVCKAYKNIVDCYYIKAAKVCGYNAAATIKELMKDVVDAVINIRCSSVNRDPYVRDPMPESYIKRSKVGTVQTCHYVVISISLLTIYLNQ